MDGWTAFRSCDRAREAVSRALDGDLSLFEARRLASHLDVCADCQAFQATVGAAARELRAAPLEQLSAPIALPRRRVLRPVQGSIAAAMAAAAVLLLTVTAPVDLDVRAPVRFAAPAPDELRIVADGQTLPASVDYEVTPELVEQPVPE
jgi:ferric-dicitrate binding protein FerR (iron transport regulator)